MKNKYINFIQDYFKIKKHILLNSKKPFQCLFAVTHNCNSRCIMCNFWKNKSKNELTLEEIKKLFSSKLMRSARVTISGGETLLRPDIGEIIQTIYDSTGSRVGLGTNGLLPDKLDKLLKEKKDLISVVSVSIDGLEKFHDKIRGIPGAFKLANKSIKIIEKHGIKPNICMTITNKNYDELKKVFDYYKNKNFDFKVAQTSECYFGTNIEGNFMLNDKQKKHIISQIKKLPKSVNKLYNIFLEDWIKGSKRPKCHAGKYEIYIDAHGNIQPCIHKEKFGNIRKKNINDIWFSKGAEKFRLFVPNCKDCYERCTVSEFKVIR